VQLGVPIGRWDKHLLIMEICQLNSARAGFKADPQVARSIYECE